ncbi:MAG: lipoyl synthase [Candidatus Lambdaproteobacteria bacterium RIFOXYD2_FULL_50_16]|uniref:Lipoyl synthase n=1 Tax=Candidatus Lambdaproteobacteria bacterium RIFOXYD2_FULL_50_16 TaxID=1817772 RepID=A0A1F6GFP1_9PROT|nr:MAG: lipoyl synthase [Candidatus Lambdaproteobacteria bacterium RIFOXYD2_FULL_50_16]
MSRLPIPPWIKTSLPKGQDFRSLQGHKKGLPTVCEEARCPNLGECWSSGTATFMLLGESCTRACRFCSVETLARPALPDPGEPTRIAQAAKDLRLKYLVLTSVDRDDLPDQGAQHLADCVQAAQTLNPELKIELLAPDFRGDQEALEIVLKHPPLVLGHNLEVVERLTQKVRDPRCGYKQSLKVLKTIKELRPDQLTKSSLMLGFGETLAEVEVAMKDLREAKVDFLTLGQYLQPSRQKLLVTEYIKPEIFDQLGQMGRELGFLFVASGPMVRSSYKAFEYFLRAQ